MVDYLTLGRDKLLADRTYYVRKDGSNSNTGLTNNAAGAKLTVMGAMDALAQIDFNGYTVNVQIDDGTYSERVIVPATVGQKLTDNLQIKGNATTPSNVIISNTGSFQPALEVLGPARCNVANLRLTAPTNGYCINAAESGVVNMAGGVDFGVAGQFHMYANGGGVINCFNPYTISGGAIAHWAAAFCGHLFATTTINAGGGAIAFTQFAQVYNSGAMQVNGCTFSNVASVTGKRYDATSNGSIQTFGAGASYLPGNAAGTPSTGGVYQ